MFQITLEIAHILNDFAGGHENSTVDDMENRAPVIKLLYRYGYMKNRMIREITLTIHGEENIKEVLKNGIPITVSINGKRIPHRDDINENMVIEEIKETLQKIENDMREIENTKKILNIINF